MAAPKGGHYEGMPQLDPAFMPNMVFWFVVTIVIIYFVLDRIALPRIGGIIEDRASGIANDLDKAAELRDEATKAEAAYEQALIDARAEANKIATETRAEIQKDLDAAIAKADAEIAAKAAESEKRVAEIRSEAMKSVEDVAKDTAAAIVSAVSPVKGDAKSIAGAVGDLLKGSKA